MHDVLVAGGGPAGLAVALGAARAGLHVVVCEKRPDVIDKACGEGLMPGALTALQALGVDPPGCDIEGISYRQGASHVQARFTGAPGRGVRRTTLHAALRAAVLEHGVKIEERTVGAIEDRGDHVRAAGFEARYLVAADGLHSPIRRQVGLTRAAATTPRGPQRWGQRQHFACRPLSPFVEVVWAEHSEAYVTPVDADTIGIAVLSGVRGSFVEQLRAFPELAERVAGVNAVSGVRGAGPLRQEASGRRAGRVLLVGDAAGYIDALTGEGLALSLAGAAQLVSCLVAGRPEAYDRAWTRISRRSRWITSGLLWARTRPALHDRIVPLAVRTPRLFTAAVNQLAQ